MGDAILVGLRDRLDGNVRPALHRALRQGFLGGMDIDDQIGHALGFVAAAERARGHPPRSVVDLGTGGGLPGLVLCSLWPDSDVVMVDANARRVAFLEAEAERWPRAAVVHARAELIGRQLSYRGSAELVTARSFATPAVTAECAAPLLGLHGSLLVSEPPEADPELRWPAAGCAELGLQRTSLVRVDDRFGYQVLTKVAHTPTRYPRRVGIPAKRPLF